MAEIDTSIKESVVAGSMMTGGSLSTTIMGTLLNDVVTQARMGNIGFITACTNANHVHSRASEVLDKRIAELDTVEASANVRDRTGYDAQSQAHSQAKAISELSAAVAQSNVLLGDIVATIAQLLKGVQLTPPYKRVG